MAARASLDEVLTKVADAERVRGTMQGARLVEVNESLIVAAVQAQADHDAAKVALVAAQRSAQCDPLTKLPNRAVMLDRLRQAIAFSRRHRTLMAVLFVDLDRFKEINDSFGHAVGDQALQLAAQCFVASVRKQDTVSRHGGDEFVIVLPEVARAADAVLVAEKVVQALRHARCPGAEQRSISASIGISIYPDAGADAETLIQHADTAMYLAKKQGLGIHVFGSAQAAAAGPAGQACEVDEAQEKCLLRQANERLVVAAVNAQALQVAADRTNRLQAARLAWLANELRQPIADTRPAAVRSARKALRAAFLERGNAIRREARRARALQAQTPDVESTAAKVRDAPR
jgi:diguanylate cyclase (GGDEF)-like protein